MEAIVANLLGATALTLSLGGVANVPAPNGAHAAPIVTAQWPGYGYYGYGYYGYGYYGDGAPELAQVGDGWVAGLGGFGVAQVGGYGWVAGLGGFGVAQVGAPAFANLGATTFAGLGRVRTPTRPTSPTDEATDESDAYVG
jgi:hypothetical protein